MKSSVYVFDPTTNDHLSKVRGVGRYLQILKENFPDWSFTNSLNPNPYTLTPIFINPFFNFLQPPLTLRRVAKKQLAVIHDLIPLKYPKHFPVGVKGKLNIFLNKLALRNYDLVVTDSETSRRDIIEKLKVKSQKVKVIYPCLPKIFTPSLVIPSEARNLATERSINKNNYASLPRNDIGLGYCLYVGDSTWNKNLVNLAKAIKIINVTCIFVGNVFNPLTRKRVNELTSYNKWQEEFKLFLKETANDKRFVFLGYIPDDKLIQLYQQARCNVFVSRDEGFGFSYLEAASQGCPSVLSDIQVFHETSKNQGALYVNPDDPNDITNTVGEVYFNKDLRNRLGVVARERAK